MSTPATLTTDLLELMMSKICHDLISPIGAVCNGVEFLEEMGPEAGDDVTSLIAFSAKQASAKLQAFRMAYGAGGLDSGIKFENVHDTFEATIALDKKHMQEWTTDYMGTPENLPAGFCKILLAVLLIGVETLPKGGKLSIDIEGETKATVSCQGENASMPDGCLEALTLNIDESAIAAKQIHFYVIGLLAKQHGYALVCNTNDGQSVDFSFEKL